MTTIDQLWQAKQDAAKAERAASAAHDTAEQHGSGPAYDVAFEALAEARIRLQQAEEQYDAAQAAA